MSHQSRVSAGGLAAVAVSAALLVGAGVVNHGYPTAADAAPYHAAVLEAVESTPRSFGAWEGRPVELPPSAVELLRPNALLSRSYVDPADRRRAEFLVVQCRDARDLSGHWPPNCYKANGYTAEGVEPRTWTVGAGDKQWHIPGVEYAFSIDTQERRSRIVVANFMVLPGAGYVPDMAAVREAGADPRRRALGAAQVQVVTDASISRPERDAILVEMVEGHRAAIETIAWPDASSQGADRTAD